MIRLLGALTATLMAGLVVGLGTAPAAQAASCSGSSGVTVVVDFGELGGGVVAGCDTRRGQRAASTAFSKAGFKLDYATRSAGFVCKVSGLPMDEACVMAAPSDRYWSLWWNDGKGGSWAYSSLGAGALNVPDGGYVAFAWHQGAGKAGAPGVSPVRRVEKATATPTPRPTQRPTRKESAAPARPEPTRVTTAPSAPAASASTLATTAPATPAESASATPTVSASAAETSATASATPSETATASPTVTAEVTSQAPSQAPAADAITAGPRDVKAVESDSDGSLPVWVPIGVVVALLVAAGAVAVRRRAN